MRERRAQRVSPNVERGGTTREMGGLSGSESHRQANEGSDAATDAAAVVFGDSEGRRRALAPFEPAIYPGIGPFEPD